MRQLLLLKKAEAGELLQLPSKWIVIFFLRRKRYIWLDVWD